MSKNCVFAGQSPARSLPVPSGTKSGDPVKVGDFIGVCETDRNDGTTPDPSGNPVGYASVAPDGTYSLLVPEVVSTVGTLVYIKSDNTLTTTASGNRIFGHTRPTILRGAPTGGTKVVDGATPLRVNVELAQV